MKTWLSSFLGPGIHNKLEWKKALLRGGTGVNSLKSGETLLSLTECNTNLWMSIKECNKNHAHACWTIGPTVHVQVYKWSGLWSMEYLDLNPDVMCLIVLIFELFERIFIRDIVRRFFSLVVPRNHWALMWSPTYDQCFHTYCPNWIATSPRLINALHLRLGLLTKLDMSILAQHGCGKRVRPEPSITRYFGLMQTICRVRDKLLIFHLN